MKINYIIKSILFSILILPLFQVYGQSLDEEKCYQIDWELTRTYKENSDTLIEPKNPTIEQAPAIATDFAKIIPSLPPNPSQTGQVTVIGETAKEAEIEKLMALALPAEKTEQYSGTANYTTSQLSHYLVTLCWPVVWNRIQRHERGFSAAQGTWTGLYNEVPKAVREAAEKAVNEKYNNSDYFDVMFIKNITTYALEDSCIDTYLSIEDYNNNNFGGTARVFNTRYLSDNVGFTWTGNDEIPANLIFKVQIVIEGSTGTRYRKEGIPYFQTTSHDVAYKMAYKVNQSIEIETTEIEDDPSNTNQLLANVYYANPVQVIEAPKLELSAPHDSPYDLVANKPFMVRTEIHKLYQDMDLPSNTTAVFNTVLKIEKEENGEYKEMKVDYTCPGANKTESKKDCMIKAEDFGDEFNPAEIEGDGTKYYGRVGREFRIKKGLDAGIYRITVSLESGLRPSCERFVSSNSFEIEVHEIKSPRIGLARANCDQLDYIDSQGMLQECTVTDSVMDNWTTKYDATTKPDGNKEIDFFNRFFPVRENNKKFFRAELYIDRLLKRNVKKINQSLITQPSNENQQTLTYEKRILLAFQAKNLTEHKLLFRYNYLVGIGSDMFFKDKFQGLNSPNDAGVAFTNLDAPFNRVAFVDSGELNKGTLLHELGHLFGQYKEFYGFTDVNGNYLPDDQQYLCTAHDLKIRNNMGGFDTTLIPCYNFNKNYSDEDGQYYNYDFKTGEHISKQQSIMGAGVFDPSTRHLPDKDKLLAPNQLEYLAMDRDTYIASFNHLKNPPRDPKITLISGIYAKGKIFNAQVNNHGAGMLHPLSSEGDLHIMLKDSSDQMLVETKVSSSFSYEALKAGGGEHVSIPDLAPIVVAFPYQEKAVKAVIMKGEEIIFSKDLPIDNNPQHLFSSHNTHSTVTNFPMLEHSHKVDLLNRKAKKATSSSFTKFMYSPAFEMSFSYNACSKNLGSEDGIAILLGKDPADYTADKLKAGNQGVKFNNKGLSLHLNMNKRIQLRDGGGQVLDSRRYEVEMGCYDWKVLKLTIDENNKLTLKERDKILLSYDLTVSQIEEIASHPIGFSAYSNEKGLYGVRHVKITALPVDEEN